MTVDIEPLELFRQAGPVVRSVAVILAVLSLWCWTIIVNALVGLFRVKATLRDMRRSRSDRAGLMASGIAESAQGYIDEALFERRHRIESAMRRRSQEFIEQAQGNIGNLAVIASVAPFIGLFGTVWGIMTSFVGIAAAKDTSLAVVAPGIAEALGATALGLVAAIPAAFAYNRLAAAFGKSSRAINRQMEAAVPEIASAPATIPSARSRAS